MRERGVYDTYKAKQAILDTKTRLQNHVSLPCLDSVVDGWLSSHPLLPLSSKYIFLRHRYTSSHT